ncbi:MAG: ferrochelatase [Alphaproteobacteria bacterium]|nr:ferrochelatase [Alphaproteobacteria bacterium]
MKVAVVLFNLGGPDSPEAVEPFLRNLFSDKAVIPLPKPLRLPLARWIAKRRAPIAREIYRKIGGRSPILPETEKQARALDAALARRGIEARSFIAMRAWKPFALSAAQEIRGWGADRVVLLPLYPQFSTTTTASSLDNWWEARKRAGLTVPQSRACCYPWEDGFIAALAELIATAMSSRKSGVDYCLLLSAHGLPKRTIAKGDPYQWQVERTAQAVVDRLGIDGLDWSLCYQSRVGPMEWIDPATDDEIRRAGTDGKGVIVAPIAFVSEHSETLVELDIDYRNLAKECGVPDYIRVPAVGTHPLFIEGLANMVQRALDGGGVVTCGPDRICPPQLSHCGFGNIDG